MDADEQLAAIRALTNREPPPYPDLRGRVRELEDDVDTLNHKLKSREFENSSLYRRVERLEEELLAERQRGAGNLPGVTVHASQEYAHEKDLSNHQV